ncbi:hypothetical protein CSC73_05680 [Pseudoxanthomonas sacheonensis]|nr:hypothetical protein CSC73_05680 [Pseudoxanthomonas sacheonensis]
MDWSDEQATKEFAWLNLMAKLKYDDYRDFLAGMRFLESLVAWLQQFKPEDRPAAYEFVRKRLVFISAAERQRLVEMLYPEVIWPELVNSATTQLNIPSWRVLVDAKDHLETDRRKTLFLALSDGARLDTFRHANVGRISNEQVVVTVDPSAEKWIDLLKELRKDVKDDAAHFTRIVLVDDFTASGTSLLRKEDDGAWKGKLQRFLASIKEIQLVLPFDLLVHHLIGTPKAADHLTAAIKVFKEEQPTLWEKVRNTVLPTYGWLYPTTLKLSSPQDDQFLAIAKHYYDPSIRNSHTDKGGSENIHLGYADCALPLVLDHNTPNNSVALLWAESETDNGSAHRMRPLFRRRQRHS